MTAPVVTSDEWWAFGGVPLNKWGWTVSTVGPRLSIPPIRGDNTRAAGVPGELWLPKIPDARTITLNMTVVGWDPDTGEPVDDGRLRFNDSWAYLRQLFFNPSSESPLESRWWRTDGGGLPQLVWAQAYAQLASGQDVVPQMNSRTMARFDVPLRLAHPFFYGPQVSVTLTPGVAVTVSNPGDWDAWSRWLYVDLVGPLTAPRVTNSTPAVPVYCGLTGNVAAGETVTLDVREYLALSARAGSATITNRTGEIYNSGTRPWVALARGANRLTLTAGGSGHAVLRFRPPYL